MSGALCWPRLTWSCLLPGVPARTVTLRGQALAEKEGQHADNGDFHETLHGALIGADSDR